MRFALLCLALMVFCGAGWQPNTGRPSPSRGVTIGNSPVTKSGSSSSYGNKSTSPSNSRVSGAVSGLQNAPVGRSADFTIRTANTRVVYEKVLPALLPKIVAIALMGR